MVLANWNFEYAIELVLKTVGSEDDDNLLEQLYLNLAENYKEIKEIQKYYDYKEKAIQFNK